MAALSLVLGRVCSIQSTYGRQKPESLESMVDGFAWQLDDCSMPDIIGALKFFCRESDQLPTPSDIRKIIDGRWKEERIEAESDEYGYEPLAPEDEERNARYFRG